MTLQLSVSARNARYLFLDDLLDVAKFIDLAGQTAIKNWLVNNGYDAKVINALTITTNQDFIEALCNLLKLTKLQYKSGSLG